MSQYHLNPETQKPGHCYAKSPESCKFNDGSTSPEHFSTREEAHKAAEKNLEEQFGKNSIQKTSKTKRSSRDNQVNSIKETMLNLGFNDRRKQVERMLQNPDTYKGSMPQEFSDRANGIKYLFYPDSKAKMIKKVEILENGGIDYTQEELKNIERELNRTISSN